MTAANQRTSTRLPGSRRAAPGGTATLAGRPVARIGFGAMQLERLGTGRDTALAIVRQAAGAGVNHIDTAHFYGEANVLIRDALAPYAGRSGPGDQGGGRQGRRRQADTGAAAA